MVKDLREYFTMALASKITVTLVVDNEPGTPADSSGEGVRFPEGTSFGMVVGTVRLDDQGRPVVTWGEDQDSK